MKGSSSLSRGKVYIIVFLVLGILYITFWSLRISKDVPRHTAEHFEDSYQYRMEVMKVFDMYMNRNPTTDELDKYASLKNEQDILTSILKDFNISVTDVDMSKLHKGDKKEGKEPNADKSNIVEAETISNASNASNVSNVSNASNAPAILDSPSINLSHGTGGPTAPPEDHEEFAEKKEKMVCIPKKSYEELKSILATLYAQLEERDA